MAQATAAIIDKPAWVDLSSSDAQASRDFYSKVFGWKVEVNPDPQYGGYALAKLGDQDAAGIGPAQTPDTPTAWSVYIGTDDIDALAKRVQSAGGTVVAPPFDVGDQGKMAVFQDPSGAFISAWQGSRMGGFQTDAPNSFGWAELNARGIEKAIPFYTSVFGWTTRTSEMGEGQPPYTEFLLDGESVAGAWEMSPMVPAEVPSYWQVYFAVDDVDGAFRKAIDAGARETAAAAGLPGRTLRDRERPAGREPRPAQDDAPLIDRGGQPRPGHLRTAVAHVAVAHVAVAHVAGVGGACGGWAIHPGATTASVPRGRLHAMTTAPSPSRMTTSLTHGPRTGREDRRTTTAAPAASTASSRHRLAFSPRITRPARTTPDERVGDIPGDDREHETGAEDRDESRPGS